MHTWQTVLYGSSETDDIFITRFCNIKAFQIICFVRTYYVAFITILCVFLTPTFSKSIHPLNIFRKYWLSKKNITSTPLRNSECFDQNFCIHYSIIDPILSFPIKPPLSFPFLTGASRNQTILYFPIIFTFRTYVRHPRYWIIRSSRISPETLSEIRKIKVTTSCILSHIDRYTKEKFYFKGKELLLLSKR